LARDLADRTSLATLADEYITLDPMPQDAAS